MAWTRVREFLKASTAGNYRRYRKALFELKAWTARDDAAVRFYSQFVRPGEICFDVGANVGNRTKVFHRIGAIVVAVEPQVPCVRVLDAAFGGDDRVRLVQSALGAEEGEACIRICDMDVLSSLSDHWIGQVSKSGRFPRAEWGRAQKCRVTTLDALIKQYGVPSFVKIDVEGYEHQVLRGLTTPVKRLSFEFTPETFETASSCLEYLDGLGFAAYNFSSDESLTFAGEWMARDGLMQVLESFRGNHTAWGDIYASTDPPITA